MQPLKLAIDGAWLVFWIYWLASAASSKQSVSGGWRTRLTGVSVGGRQHCVRAAPPAQELQVHIGQRHPNPGNQATGAVTRTDRVRILSMHCRLPSSRTTKPVKDGRNEKEDHRHNMHVSETLNRGATQRPDGMTRWSSCAGRAERHGISRRTTSAGRGAFAGSDIAQDRSWLDATFPERDQP
jgi:hypothetical protein